MVMVEIKPNKPIKLVLASSPWLSGALAKAAREAGVNVKKIWVLRSPPPWSKERKYIFGASKAQLEVWRKFGKVAAKTRGMPIEKRIMTIREQMTGFSAPGKKYEYEVRNGRKVPVKPPRRVYEQIKLILEGKKVEKAGEEEERGGVKV